MISRKIDLVAKSILLLFSQPVSHKKANYHKDRPDNSRPGLHALLIIKNAQLRDSAVKKKF